MRSNRNIFLCFAAAFFIPLGAATAAMAQGPCAASRHSGDSSSALAITFAVSQHTGCDSGTPSGAATHCDRETYHPTASRNFLSAKWPSPNARSMDAVGGCLFMCTSGNCRVGNDGLPVELLEFGVE